jgi:GNAT superfamily N-acetyltransferase
MTIAAAGDAEVVAGLMAAFRDHYGDPAPSSEEILSVVTELLADPQTEFLITGDPPTGVAQMRYRLSVWTGTEDAWLEDLFVVEQARGTGAGRALAEACIERARDRGCGRIQLDTNEDNEPALRLYKSLGFTTSKREGHAGRDMYLTKWLT